MAAWDSDTIIEIDGISKASFHEGHRVVELMSDDDAVRLAFTEKAALDTAVQLLQLPPTDALGSGYGFEAQGLLAARDDSAGLVLTFDLGGGTRISLALPMEAEAALREALLEDSLPIPPALRH